MNDKLNKLLILAVLFFTGLTAFGGRVTVEWNIPGACRFQTGSYNENGTPVDVPDNAVSFVYESETSGYFYIIANEGYKFESVLVDGESQNTQTANGVIYYGRYISTSADIAINATLVPIDRSSSLTINIQNGSRWMEAVFNDGYSIDLHNGENVVYYDPELEKSLTFTCINGVEYFYSITLNGETVERNAWNKFYYLPTLQSGDVIDIRVFEGEEPVLHEYTVTLDLPADLEDCIYSVYDSTNSRFLDFVDNQLTLIGGTNLAINLKQDDYEFTAFYINGEDAASNYRNGSLRFVVDCDMVVKIEGHPKVYDTIDFTAFIANPEGVVLYCSEYHKNPADLSAGQAIDESFEIGEYTFTTQNTEKFIIPVSSKRPMIFVAPASGYYIATVRGMEEGAMSEISVVTLSSQTFYVYAKKLDDYQEAKIDIKGDVGCVRLRASTKKSMLWDNPSTEYTLTEPESIIRFIPDYDLPLSITPINPPANFSIYLDGASVSANENGIYMLTPWYAEDNNSATVMSTITVGATGTPLRTSKTTIVAKDGLTAELKYGEVDRTGKPDGQLLLSGTPIAIIPSSRECTIRLGDTLINGYEEDGTFISALNEEGAYKTVTTNSNATYTISELWEPGNGIGYLAASMERTTVYNSLGMVILKDASAEDILNLPQGLYIINGKKYLHIH